MKRSQENGGMRCGWDKQLSKSFLSKAFKKDFSVLERLYAFVDISVRTCVNGMERGQYMVTDAIAQELVRAVSGIDKVWYIVRCEVGDNIFFGYR